MLLPTESFEYKRWGETLSIAWKLLTGKRFILLLLFYILATSKVISGCVPTCDRANSWSLNSASPLGNQAISTMNWYPTHSLYPDTDPTSPCLILIMLSAWLGSDKYQFSSHWFNSAKFQSHDVRISWFLKMGDRCSTHLAILSGLGHQKWKPSK